MISPRISTRQLAELCRRLATALEAGVDARTVWNREAERASGRAARDRIGRINGAVHQGDTLAEGFARTGNYFPDLVRELVAVGEQTGHLPDVLHQLADHYDLRLKLRREFLSAVSWPLVQLALALGVIGLLILVMGIIGDIRGQTIDILGFGLVGPRGLLIYVGFLAGVAAVLGFLGYCTRRGMVWTRPVQRLAMRLPKIGRVLQTLSTARFAWSLSLALGAGMDVRRAMKLAMSSTRNARYTDRIQTVDDQIALGNSIYDSLRAGGVFPPDFLDSVAVGEESGNLVESMERVSRAYHDQARAALGVLNTLLGVVVWLIVAALIIAMIFRLFSFYLGVLNEAMP